MWETGYNWLDAYDRSKLANIYFTRELFKRLDSDTKVVSLNPGSYIWTNVLAN